MHVCLRYSLCLALCFLASCQLPAAALNTTQCDRPRAQAARAVLRQFVLPKAEALRFQLPPSCPLDPKLDLHARQEGAKVAKRHGQWKCGFCGKAFRGEHYLDAHFENRHADEVNPESTVCLANFTEALHGTLFAWQLDSESVQSPYAVPCRPSSEDRLRQACQELAGQCFPTDSGHPSRAVRLLHEYFVHHFCAAHTCDEQRQQQLIKAVIKANRPPRWSIRILVGLGILGVVLFYAGLWLHYSYHSYHSQGDMRHLRPRRAETFWSLLGRKKKVY